MREILTGLGIFAAITAVLAVGFLLPSDDVVKDDPFEPNKITTSLANLGDLNPDVDLVETVNPHQILSSLDTIRSGRFKYSENTVSWRFVPPINWGNVPAQDVVAQAIQQWAMVDPFLVSFDETGNVEDFDQAVFFMLDWQAFHQTARKVTRYAWDIEMADARAARLAYALSVIENNPDMQIKTYRNQLIGLSDFHIQRMSHPDFGGSIQKILELKGFKALCDVLDGLSSCQI